MLNMALGWLNKEGDSMRRQMTAMIFFWIFLILSDWIQWDIIAQISAYYNGLTAGIFLICFTLVRVFVFIILIAWSIYFIKQKYAEIKMIAFLPILVLLLTVVSQTLIPLSNAYIYTEHNCRKETREHIVAMLEGTEDTQLVQTNMDTYLLPLSLRGASHNAKITTEKSDASLKVLFYIHKGIFKNSAVIYSSDNQSVKNGDFKLEYQTIKLIVPCWYAVIY